MRSLDYNPDRLHMLVSGAEDGMLKFWDGDCSRRACCPAMAELPCDGCTALRWLHCPATHEADAEG